jgi:hypothetical protein
MGVTQPNVLLPSARNSSTGCIKTSTAEAELLGVKEVSRVNIVVSKALAWDAFPANEFQTKQDVFALLFLSEMAHKNSLRRFRRNGPSGFLTTSMNLPRTPSAA